LGGEYFVYTPRLAEQSTERHGKGNRQDIQTNLMGVNENFFAQELHSLSLMRSYMLVPWSLNLIAWFME
jgi:hypothetical protein